MSRTRVILSDLHLGDPQSTLNLSPVRQGLRHWLCDLGDVQELILAGDILEGNFGSLDTAIEGSADVMGFRGWLADLLADGRFRPRRIVFIPGNHDYAIWHLLSTQRAFMRPLDEGRTLPRAPLRWAEFENPFLAGVAPEPYRDRFVVCYPDHRFGSRGQLFLVTHGHYFDDSQSLRRNLKAIIRAERGNVRAAVRRFFVSSAMYQSLAGSVSYVPWRKSLVGRTYGGIASVVSSVGLLRGMPIDAQMLEAMEYYLAYYYHRPVSPDVLVFGHTHRPARARSGDFGRTRARRIVEKEFTIYNVGSFVQGRSSKCMGTFLVVDPPSSSEHVLRLAVDATGVVHPL